MKYIMDTKNKSKDKDVLRVHILPLLFFYSLSNLNERMDGYAFTDLVGNEMGRLIGRYAPDVIGPRRYRRF